MSFTKVSLWLALFCLAPLVREARAGQACGNTYCNDYQQCITPRCYPSCPAYCVNSNPQPQAPQYPSYPSYPSYPQAPQAPQSVPWPVNYPYCWTGTCPAGEWCKGTAWGVRPGICAAEGQGFED